MTDTPTPPEQNQPPAYPAVPPTYPNQYGTPIPSGEFANWGQRVGAYLLDAVVPLPLLLISAVGAALLAAGSRSTFDAQGNAVQHINGLGVIGVVVIILGYLAYVAFAIWNIVFRQGRTGWSIGKKIVGIRLVGTHTGQPVGPGRAFVRQLAHFFDGLLCYVGYLWPLWDAKRQTFADKLLTTVVIPAAEPRKP
jgi:uncharacterized RDD family membrane protein YckC